MLLHHLFELLLLRIRHYGLKLLMCIHHERTSLATAFLRSQRGIPSNLPHLFAPLSQYGQHLLLLIGIQVQHLGQVPQLPPGRRRVRGVGRHVKLLVRMRGRNPIGGGLRRSRLCLQARRRADSQTEDYYPRRNKKLEKLELSTWVHH